MNKECFLKNDFLVIENFLEKPPLDCLVNINKIKKWNDPNKGFPDRQKNNNKNEYESHENYSVDFAPTSNRLVANINELNSNLKEILDVFRSNDFLENLYEEEACKKAKMELF